MTRERTKTSVRKSLDNLWSLAVKKKANNRCEVCHKAQSLNSHHIVGRRNLQVRWDIRNGVCLCVKHHKFGVESAHEDPLWFREWLEENRWEDYSYLYCVKNEIAKWTLEDLIEKEQELKEYLS